MERVVDAPAPAYPAMQTEAETPRAEATPQRSNPDCNRLSARLRALGTALTAASASAQAVAGPLPSPADASSAMELEADGISESSEEDSEDEDPESLTLSNIWAGSVLDGDDPTDLDSNYADQRPIEVRFACTGNGGETSGHGPRTWDFCVQPYGGPVKHRMPRRYHPAHGVSNSAATLFVLMQRLSCAPRAVEEIRRVVDRFGRGGPGAANLSDRPPLLWSQPVALEGGAFDRARASLVALGEDFREVGLSGYGVGSAIGEEAAGYLSRAASTWEPWMREHCLKHGLNPDKRENPVRFTSFAERNSMSPPHFSTR